MGINQIDILNEKTEKKEYYTPELKDFGKIGEKTNTTGDPFGSINDGGGFTVYTS